jgi:hypothetical protein
LEKAIKERDEARKIAKDSFECCDPGMCKPDYYLEVENIIKKWGD